MVLLRRIELFRSLDDGHDWSFEPLLRSLQRCLRRSLLLCRRIEDGGAVLRPDVRALPVLRRRVVDPPEDVEERIIRRFLRVVLDQDRLRVPSPAAAHPAVARLLGVAARVSGRDCGDARHLSERLLDVPETAGSEDRSHDGFRTLPGLNEWSLIMNGKKELLPPSGRPSRSPQSGLAHRTGIMACRVRCSRRTRDLAGHVAGSLSRVETEANKLRLLLRRQQMPAMQQKLFELSDAQNDSRFNHAPPRVFLA